jgi:hypothetical protein
MSQLLRLLIIPMSIIPVILAFVTGKYLLFLGIAGALVLVSVIVYSGRKQRVRYWLQGYKNQLENNDNNVEMALQAIKKEFCMSKYADEDICGNTYSDIDTLVLEIIKREFNLKRLLETPAVTPEQIQQNLVEYRNAIQKIKSEIIQVKKERL